MANLEGGGGESNVKPAGGRVQRDARGEGGVGGRS